MVFIFITQTKHQLNSKVGWGTKMTLIHPPTTTQIQCQQYLSCYWPDFNQTLKLGSWDEQQQQQQQQLQQPQQQEQQHLQQTNNNNIKNISSINYLILTTIFLGCDSIEIDLV